MGPEMPLGGCRFAQMRPKTPPEAATDGLEWACPSFKETLLIVLRKPTAFLGYAAALATAQKYNKLLRQDQTFPPHSWYVGRHGR
jgi:hypothetical protein